MCYSQLIRAGAMCGWLLAGLSPGRAALADTLWHWTDLNGQSHFSDTPPAQASASGRQIRLDSRPPAAAGGLRAGERQALRRLEQRRTRQQQQALAARRRHDQAMAARRDSCRASRDQLRRAREREQRKQLSGYLRKHCW
jgi:hypothetical protein